MFELLRKIRVALTPRNSLLKTRLPCGAVVFGRNRAGFGGRGIYIFREDIEPEFRHLEKFLGESGVFVDVGANTGIYTIKAAKHYERRGGQVLAIEPFPDVLASLYRSVRENGFTNVRLRNFCIGETSAPVTFWMNYDRPNSFSLIRHDDSAAALNVLGVTLDDLLEWEDLPALDYLKVDVEGAESGVLAGARRSLEMHRPIVQAEVSIRDFRFELPDYSIFQAPGSDNNIFVPDESPKISVPRTLGWSEISRD